VVKFIKKGNLAIHGPAAKIPIATLHVDAMKDIDAKAAE
jgi:hypothetical protein